MATVTIKGGARLESALKKIAKNLSNASTVRVGFLEGSDYPDGTPVAMVAAIQNFGAPKVGIPPRPFFSNMVKAKSPGWPNAIAKILPGTGYDARATLSIMGEGIMGDLQQSIIDTMDPPLSPVTVMLRGMKSKGVKITGRTVGEAARRVADGKTNYGASTKPLIDSGVLLRAVAKEVT